MMRALGLVGLLLALVIVGMLVKKQMAAAVPALPAEPSSSALPMPKAPLQGPQFQQELKQSLDAAMQQPRAMPDDAK